MTDNRYAPPSARVADPGHTEAAPPLWNPNAAANWSLLLTPAFGAYLHMRNWEALGETRRAAASRNWIYVTLAAVVISSAAEVFIEESRRVNALSRLSGLVLLLAWYFSSGRSQASYVKVRFGKDYERRPWGRPLLLAFAMLVGFYFVVGFLIGFAMSLQGRS